jgi:O-antigen/teichoic acid export membrane protein
MSMFWRGLVGYLPANIVQGIVGLLSVVVFTRVLTPAAYGAYAVAFSAASLAHTLTFTWLEAAMARFYAREAAAGRLEDHFAAVYRTFAALAAGFIVVAGAIAWLLPLAPELKGAVAAGLICVPVRSLAKLAQEHRRAAGRVAPSAMLDIGQSLGAFVIGFGLALMGAGGAAPLIGAGLAAAACAATVLPGELGLARRGHFDPSRAKEHLHYGLPVALSLVLSLALATTDRFILAAVLGPESVGVYHAGYSLSNRTLDILFIWLGAAGWPAAVMALEKGGERALMDTVREQGSLMVLICLPAAVGLALVAQPLAGLMVGQGLREGAARVTPWIAASGFFAGINTHYLNTSFTLARRTRLLLVSLAIPAAVNVVLTLVLIPRYGLDGAMWATTASYVVGSLAALALGRGAIRLPIPWSALMRCGAAAAVMAAAVRMVPAYGNAVELIAKAALGAVVYGLCAYAFDAAGVRSRRLEMVRALQGAPA